MSAGVADATPATASPSRRLSLRTSPFRPALRMPVSRLSVRNHALCYHGFIGTVPPLSLA